MPAVTVQEGDQILVFSESLPICEYFEEKYQHLPKLLPSDPFKKWQVRRLCEQINASTQPLANLGVVVEIEKRFGKEARNPWGAWANTRGLSAFETLISSTRGKYCLGDEITLADIFLIP